VTPVRLERDGDVAVVTLDNPPLNFFNAAVIDALDAALSEIERDLPRAVLFRAEGKVVSGGVDVAEFDAMDGAPAAREFFERLIQFPQRIEALPRPTVFAAHALCLTAAFELSLGCDMLLAAESAQFGLVEIVVGLTPAMGGTQRLADRAGPARARELVMTGGLYDAATLERWGVVNRVRADDGFDEAARRFAARLASGPTLAHAATKRVVARQVAEGVPAADAVTAKEAGDLFDTEDLQNAVKSFLEHGPGKATYTGR
jgi:enoyl-CoA hydratase/carnithine racemase